MHRTPLSIPEIGLIAGTRAALGAGVALLLADRLTNDQRRAVGWTLVGVGAVTTLPILVQLFKSQHEVSESENSHGARRTSKRDYALR
jgi:hypothetical protein